MRGEVTSLIYSGTIINKYFIIVISIIDIARTVTVTNAISMIHVFYTSNKYISERYYKGGIGYGVEQNEK